MLKLRHIKRQSLSAVLSAVMVFTSLPDINTYADSTREIQLPQIITENEPEIQTQQPIIYTLKKKGDVSEYGYQEMVWVDEDGNEVEKESSNGDSDNGLSRSSNIQFPSSYSMLDEGLLPPVRNQGKWGTCWAHGALCSLETNMIKKGLADKSEVDYSERHLSYFVHKRNTISGDGPNLYDAVYGWYGGGNSIMSAAQLSNWYGAAAESDYPYSAYENMEDLDESSRSSSVCHLTDANMLNTSEEVKSAVIENGAVACAYNSDDLSIDNNNYAVYNKQDS